MKINTFLLCFLTSVGCYGQDTTFHQKHDRYEISAFSDGYHLIVTAKYREKSDTVFIYKFGVYYGAEIIEAIIYDNYFVCVYEALDMAVCKSYEYKNNRWNHVAGGIIFSSSDKNVKIDGISIKKNKIELESGGHVFKFKIDFEKKTIEKEGG